jgi:hypothetical protein
MRSFDFTAMFRMMADNPTITAMLKMLDPMILPRAMSPCPCVLAYTQMNNSGKLVASATTVSPVTRGLIFRRNEIEELARTMISAPVKSSIPPQVSKNKSSSKMCKV